MQRVRTTFLDGTFADACPHDTEEYRGYAERISGHRDPWLWCLQHDMMHVLYAVVFGNGISSVLWAVAHGLPTDGEEFAAEESAVMAFQRLYAKGDGTRPRG